MISHVRKKGQGLFRAALFIFLFSAHGISVTAEDSRVFELRIYKAYPGKINQLHSRFRDHTLRFFAKYEMELIGFWTPSDEHDADYNLVYILAFPSLEAREQAWNSFRGDPEWQKAHEESIQNGKLVEKAESKLLYATDYSPIR